MLVLNIITIGFCFVVIIYVKNICLSIRAKSLYYNIGDDTAKDFVSLYARNRPNSIHNIVYKECGNYLRKFIFPKYINENFDEVFELMVKYHPYETAEKGLVLQKQCQHLFDEACSDN